MRYILFAFPILALSACASAPTAYAPAGAGRVGYHETQIENDRYRVSFTGGADVSFSRVEDLALRRAAELTLENGQDWFEVIGRDRQSRGDRDGPVSVGASAGQSFGSGGFRGSSVGVGISISPGRERRSTVWLDILTGHGMIPAGPNYYDARSVVENIPVY